jgi:hypothetical protein
MASEQEGGASESERQSSESEGNAVSMDPLPSLRELRGIHSYEESATERARAIRKRERQQ